MTRRDFILALVLAGLSACGKKGPPKRLDGSTEKRTDPDKLKKKGRS
jgi:predicted small lipoprotein YifL